MVLPTINLNGVSKVMFAYSEISKIYCGSQLAWEKKADSNLIVLYLGRTASMYAEYFEFESRIDPRISVGNIDKIVFMGKYTIKGSDVKEIGNLYGRPSIEFKSDIVSLTGYGGFIEVGEKIEVYLK